MKPLWHLIAMTLLSQLASANDRAFWDFEAEQARPFNGLIWKSSLADFSDQTYTGKTKAMLEQFEQATGKTLAPGSTGKVALKIYTNSGAGLHTPKAMVRAVIEYLVERGFSMDNICLVDARAELLRDAGYLPPLSKMEERGAYFDHVRIYPIDSGEVQAPTWFYESPLPKEYTSPLGRELLRPTLVLDPEEARKSYLPSNLLLDVDFWINMPCASHHPATGMSGALVNASLWNISNATRFFNSPANAPVAVAEIAAIPELKATWALNLISLEQYQYIAGPGYNANYTGSRPEIWMSVDPVIMDANLVQIMNQARMENGFAQLPEVPEFVLYSIQLGLGRGIPTETRVISID
jgi:hypothetical protein